VQHEMESEAVQAEDEAKLDGGAMKAKAEGEVEPDDGAIKAEAEGEVEPDDGAIKAEAEGEVEPDDGAIEAEAEVDASSSASRKRGRDDNHFHNHHAEGSLVAVTTAHLSMIVLSAIFDAYTCWMCQASNALTSNYDSVIAFRFIYVLDLPSNTCFASESTDLLPFNHCCRNG
jgi:hypothetical protein